MKKIRIIHTNDIHSNFEAIPKIATVIEKYYDDSSIVLDAGDFADFSNPLIKESKGTYALDLLSMMHYSCISVGNNEGFHSKETLLAMTKHNNVTLLSCNLLSLDGSKLDGINPYIIKEINGIKVLIIGVSPYDDSYNRYYNLKGIKAIKPEEIIRKIINEVTHDIVILNSHLGLRFDTLMIQDNLGIDLIISGHSHQLIPLQKINGTYISQVGYKGSDIGIIDITFIHNIKSYESKIISLKNVKNNERIERYMKEHEEATIKKLSVKSMQIYSDLLLDIQNEASFSNLLCDYLYDKYNGDLALINNGLLEKEFREKFVSKLDIMQCCNSPLHVVTFSVSVKQILDAFASSLLKERYLDDWRRPGYRAKVLGTLSFSYNVEILDGKNGYELIINGKKANENDVVTVITSDYLLRGMGYQEFVPNSNNVFYKEQFPSIIKDVISNKDNYKNIAKTRILIKK